MPESDEEKSKDDRAKGVERMLSDEDPPTEPPENEPGEPSTEGHPEDVGKSTTKRAEDTGAKSDEFTDTGTKDKSQRPTGTSTNEIQRTDGDENPD